jgi:flagellar biogenesis protein FliO
MTTWKFIALTLGTILPALAHGYAQGGGDEPETSVFPVAVAETNAASVAKPDTAVPAAAARPSAVEPAASRDVSGLFGKEGSVAEPADRTDAPSWSRPADSGPWRSIFATILVLGVLVAINILLRRRIRNTVPGRQDAGMSLIGALPLDHHRRLLLIAVEGKRALLCSGRDGVVSIATFDPPAENPAAAPFPSRSGSGKTSTRG